MSDLVAINKLANDTRVQESVEFSKSLHKTLVLGQTRHVCRWGTLSDGHEKITDAQRFYQAVRELYYLAMNIQDTQAQALILEADLIDAELALDAVTRDGGNYSALMRTRGKALQTRTALTRARVTCEDQMRMLDEYYKVYSELKPVVEAQYPEGIEQAEPDNWKAVARYRAAIENSTGQNQVLKHIPLSPTMKAEMGVELDRPELVAWLGVLKKDELARLAGEYGMIPGTDKQADPRALVRSLLDGEKKHENVLAAVR